MLCCAYNRQYQNRWCFSILLKVFVIFKCSLLCALFLLSVFCDCVSILNHLKSTKELLNLILLVTFAFLYSELH